jgi:CrcB protein
VVAYLLAALGGALGALARWAVGLTLPRSPGDWPWATLTVNLTGCLLIGVLLALLALRAPDAERLRTFLGAGVLGGFTTFSAFAVEVTDLVGAGFPVTAVGYVVVSVLGGILAVAAGAGSVRAVAREWE